MSDTLFKDKLLESHMLSVDYEDKKGRRFAYMCCEFKMREQEQNDKTYTLKSQRRRRSIDKLVADISQIDPLYHANVSFGKKLD